MEKRCPKCDCVIGYQEEGEPYVSTCPVVILNAWNDFFRGIPTIVITCVNCYEKLHLEKLGKIKEKENLDGKWQKFLEENPLTQIPDEL